MLREKVEGQMVLLSEGSSIKKSPEDKQASAPCVRGSTFTWGPIFSVKSGPVSGFSGGVRIFCYTGDRHRLQYIDAVRICTTFVYDFVT